MDVCSELPEYFHIPLRELTKERYEKEQFSLKTLYIVCPEHYSGNSAQDTAAWTEEVDGSTDGSSDSVLASSSGGKGSVVGGGSAESWSEGQQACIRLQKVFGHERAVFLVR